MSEYFSKYIKKNHFPIHPSQIKFKTFFTNCIHDALQYRGYKQTDGDEWNIYWCEKEFLVQSLDKMRLYPNKRINHFRNWYEICRKDLLAKNIKRYKKQLEKQGNTEEAATYDYTPLTYNLPIEYPIFLEEFKRANKAMWIMKPIGKSQGKGIFLFNKISDIQQWSQPSNQPEPYIVQRYIHNPLLIGNKKFDMRLYALVTSHNPLTVYIYRSGFGRFTHMRYEIQDITSLQSHLTNVAVQKNSQNYDEQRGGKYFIDKLRLYLNSKYGPEKVDQCFYHVQQLMIKTLIATCKQIINDKRCFQLYGYDVMIDSTLKPWLIQINGSPSMSANTEQDAKLKRGLLDDVFTIMNMERILVGDEKQVGGFDLIYKDGKRYQPNFSDFNYVLNNGDNAYIKIPKEYSMIGCFNNREQNLRKLAKIRAIKLAQQHAANQANNNNNQSNTNSNNNTYNRNTRNQSINGNVGTSNGPNNSQRGRSIMFGGPQNQAKSTQTTTNIKVPPGNNHNNAKNSGSGLMNKKSINLSAGSNLGDEVLKLPKVGPTSNGNFASIPGNFGKTDPKVNTNVYRTGSRDSRR